MYWLAELQQVHGTELILSVDRAGQRSLVGIPGQMLSLPASGPLALSPRKLDAQTAHMPTASQIRAQPGQQVVYGVGKGEAPIVTHQLVSTGSMKYL